MIPEDYIPFGDEWKAELKKTPKDFLIEQLREALMKIQDMEETHRIQLAGISTASLGYWKIGDSLDKKYETTALRDTARLYEKYAELYDKKNNE